MPAFGVEHRCCAHDSNTWPALSLQVPHVPQVTPFFLTDLSDGRGEPDFHPDLTRQILPSPALAWMGLPLGHINPELWAVRRCTGGMQA